ncbi:MAG: sensor histidine kinase [Lachnospiraceae bacterium]
MRKAKSFRARLWTCFLLYTALIFSLLWVLQTVFLQRFFNTMQEHSTDKAAAEIAAGSSSEDLTTRIDQLARDNSLLVFITDPDGTIQYSSDSYKSYYQQEEGNGTDDAKSNPYHSGEMLGWQIGAYRNLPDGYDTFLSRLASSSDGTVAYETDSRYVTGSYITLADGAAAVLYVSTILGAVGGTAGILRLQLLLVSLLSVVIASAIAWILARRFSVPVDQLSLQAGMLAADQYEPVFEKGFCRELDDLSDSMDDAACRLAEAEKYQKELLANVSHDLRTPLTMIQGYAEMIRDVSWQDAAQREADTQVILRETERLSALVNEILEYSSLSERRDTADFTEVNLGRLAEKVCRTFEPLLSRQGGTIERQIADDCTVTGSPALLERAIWNLIDNAVRHMGKAGKISVTVSGGDAVRLQVTDYGEGIDPEILPHIWERYATFRQRGKTGVSGLGLAIVRQIARLHGADCGVQSKKGEGSSFWLIFTAK